MTLNSFKKLLMHNGLATQDELKNMSIFEVYTRLNEALSRLYRLEQYIKLTAEYNITQTGELE